MSDSWTGGFVRLTCVLENGLDYTVWIRAASIFQLMVLPAVIQKVKDGPVENTIVTSIVCAYQGMGSNISVREGPDMIMAMVEAVINKGIVAGTHEE